MPSFLMPVDSDKELHLKLLDLLIDATFHYESLYNSNLAIPEKIQIKAHNDYNECLMKYHQLPKREYIVEVGREKVGTIEYKYACRSQYLKFLEFYHALEFLVVRNYMDSKLLETNSFLKNLLDKIPDKEKDNIKAMPAIAPTTPRPSPRTPREEVLSSNEMGNSLSGNRRNSTSVVTFRFSASTKSADQKIDFPKINEPPEKSKSSDKR